jgi:hypothetical protein
MYNNFSKYLLAGTQQHLCVLSELVRGLDLHKLQEEPVRGADLSHRGRALRVGRGARDQSEHDPRARERAGQDGPDEWRGAGQVSAEQCAGRHVGDGARADHTAGVLIYEFTREEDFMFFIFFILKLFSAVIKLPE